MKNIKKIIFITFVLLLSIIISGCSLFQSEVDGNEYNITYYVKGEEKDLSPSTYISGEKTTLPVLADEGFVGWFEEEDFSGDIIIDIIKNTNGDKVFYAMINTSSSIEEVISSINSYSYTLSYYCSKNEDSYESYGYYDNDNWCFTYKTDSKTYTDYFYYDNNGVATYVSDDGSKNYTELTNGDENFSNANYLPFVFLDKIENNDYTHTNGYYILNNSINDKTSYMLGSFDDETYTALTLYVNGNDLVKIVANSTWTSGFQSFKYEYNVIFSNINSTEVTIPTLTTKEITGIVASPSTFSVLRGVSLDTIKENLAIYLVYSDESREEINISECVISGNYSSSILASYEMTITYLEYSCKFKIDVVEEVDAKIEVDDTVQILEDAIKVLGEYDGVLYGLNRGLPSDGANVLVIPVDFSDYRADSEMKSVLEKSFFGTSSDTGWESLQSYYYKSSYGKALIEGTVLDVYSTNKTSSYFEELEDDVAACRIIKDALEYYDSSVDYSKYDSDGDGYIDSIYLIYTAPVNYTADDSLYWAFSYEYNTDQYEYYDNVEADFCTFIGYDFLFEDLASKKNVIYNTETIIHESGHLFGLDDYYDYDSTLGDDGGIGGGDMMDYNVGDHNPYSKLILGWTTPTVIDASKLSRDITIDLSSFGSSGDCIIICNGWNNTYFDEYYIIDFYTPDGLNAIEAGYSGLFSNSGIRIYHIDATLKSASDANGVWEMTKYNNSDAKYKLIKLIQADGLNEIENSDEYGDNDDLFYQGTTFKDIKWYDNTSADFRIYVEMISGTEARIVIKVN